ncbi:hypothetical protein MUK42_13190 [Musa troglodytarum]|uniref:Uncharacterized protein n=1 Tax=Musa troglodytarum TaxID=320322 RepID=A0A9E7KZD6_9LILI|nr:hypothetical protein MUK42_13190 [Musa troglodytarum]
MVLRASRPTPFNLPTLVFINCLLRIPTGNLRRTIIVLAKRGNCMRLKDSQTSTSSWPYLRRGFPWKMLRQDWIPRFSVLGHHGLKRMIEVRLPRDLYLESYHEGLKKWVDVGNSGMFTPEMVLPMHGVSLER